MRNSRRGARLDKPSLDLPNDAIVALCMALEALENVPDTSLDQAAAVEAPGRQSHAITRGASRCPDCLARRRGTTSQRGYGATHQRRARTAIAAQPWCSERIFRLAREPADG